MAQTYNHSNASLSRKEAKSEGKDISGWYKGKPTTARSKALGKGEKKSMWSGGEWGKGKLDRKEYNKRFKKVHEDINKTF